MKKIYSLLLLAVTSVSFGQTIYTENMGTPTANTLIPAYATGTAPATFQNGSPIVYTGTADVRTSLPSSGYSGASGNGNVLINSLDEFFQIDGINTSAFATSGLQLSFGVNTPTAVTNVLTVEVSTDASNWTPLTYTPSATNWTLATITSGIPQTTSLSIRFKSTSSTLQFRVDDVKVFNLNASCTLVLSTPTTLCNASTFALDTYSATINYTGGGSGSYTITPSSGTVAGDNPGSVAAGAIIINGITEGTNLTVNIVSGSCSYQATANAPECKPVNPLPYKEPFPYAAGASLGASQRWTNVNTGDNIVGVAGSLNYAGFTSADNSVSFSGAGIECFTPFTATNSGTIYSSFILNVSDLTNVTGAGETYFIGLTDALRGYKVRLFTKVTAGQYQLGLDTASTTTNYDTTLRNPGDVVFVVIGYDFTANTLNAWINPDLGTLTNATPATLTVTPTTAISELGGVILRQDQANTTPTIIFDELRVDTSISGLLATSQNNIAGLKIYPNPVSNGTLFIETAANAERTVAIYDVLGKQVLSTKTSDNAINVAGLQTGVYIVNITEEGKTATRKLVIK